jgi:Ser/Thr protein kinase RdoA (MazF antagonist)
VLDPFTLSENATFAVSEPDHERVVLRVYRPGGRPLVEVRSELAWMDALRGELGPLVPGVVRGVDRCAIVEVRPAASLPTCLCVAFTLALGAEPAAAELAAWFPRLGEITARLHRQARAWTPPSWFSRPRWDVETTIGARGHWGHWTRGVADREDRAQLQRLADVVAARLGRFGTDPARFGLVHADLRLANVLADGDEAQVIDFEDCGLSWYLYDLACALTFNEGRPDADELVAGFLDAYRTVQPLPGADEAEAPTFIMLRRLMMSAYAGLRPDIELTREMRARAYDAESCRLAERYLGAFAR